MRHGYGRFTYSTGAFYEGTDGWDVRLVHFLLMATVRTPVLSLSLYALFFSLTEPDARILLSALDPNTTNYIFMTPKNRPMV